MHLFPRLAPRHLAPFLAAVCLLAAAAPAWALRICSYNLLNYDNQYSTRDPHFRTVISNMGSLDVVAVQEIQDQTAVNRFLNNVLNTIEPGQWAAATFYDDPGVSFNQALFYRISTVDVVASGFLNNNPRYISWYTVRPDGYTASEAEITIYNNHFKAGSSGSDQATRLTEAQGLRTTMNAQPPGTHMIVLGDFNMRSSTESAYQQMVGSQADNDGRVFDPINRPGTWYNSSSFADIHTQSTRTTNLGDGGATGGMDDRFDQILATAGLLDGDGTDLVTFTYTAYGQDGLHFNDNISGSPTIPEGAAVATALENATDHLPVFVDVQLPAVVSTDASLDFGTVLVGYSAQQTLTVTNQATAPADVLDYTLSASAGFTAPGGSFQDAAGGGGNGHTITMDTAAAGDKNGTVEVDSDDPETPTAQTSLSGTVLDPAAPSLAPGGVALADTVDWGSAGEGMFSDQSVDVHNDGYDSLQALLDVYDGTITGGDGRFSIVGGFSAAQVGATPETYALTFDDAGGAPDGDSTHTATLTFGTRDDPGVLGALDRDDLVVTLTATVLGNVTGVGDEPGVRPTALAANRPNPFHRSTRIGYSLSAEGPVRVAVFDVRGRRVAELERGVFPAGDHEVTWDGSDTDGTRMPPGIYFAVLTTDQGRFTRRLTKLD